jgi:dihydroflavonol-4-reductase
MRVLVTGGTGFVGSHCVRALRDAGHRVVLLARDSTRIRRALEPLGVDAGEVDVVEGDVLERSTVGAALGRSDALLHAANVYSLNARDAERMQRVNVEGTRLVLHAAAALELDPIVHVSSIVALLPSAHVTPSSPVGTPKGPYQESKAEAERIARALQSRGAPVVVTNPGSVYGPHQPHMGESATRARAFLRGRDALTPRGGFGVVDVRYLLAGRWISYRDFVRRLGAVVGRTLPTIPVPLPLALAIGRLADVAQRRGIDPGFSYAAVWILANYPDADDGETRTALGIEWRPLDDTLRDTVAWLHEQGQITAAQAGRVAGAAWSRT